MDHIKCLGIDIGSTSIKGAVLDLHHRAVGRMVTCPFPAPLDGLPTGWMEMDPRPVCDAVDVVLTMLIDEAPEADRLYCSGQMGGLILIDDDVRPLSNYISWRDQRTLDSTTSGPSFLDAIRMRWESEDVFPQLGRELQPGSAAPLLAWLHDHDRLPSSAMPSTIADYVLGRLIGRPVPMHVTHAGGLLDLSRAEWHRGALELLSLTEQRMPNLVHQEDCVGTISLAGKNLRVFGSYGDQQCALRGAGLGPNELSLNISTGSQVSRRMNRFQPGNYQTRKYFFGDYLDTVTHLPAGRSLHVIVDLLTELARDQGVTLRDPWRSILDKAMAIESTDLEVDLAFFRGPMGNRGRIDKISTENFSAGHLFHAAFRSMADNYVQVAGRFGISDWDAVVLSGGLTQSAPLLRQLLETRFPVPIRESNGEETLAGLLDIASSTAS